MDFHALEYDRVCRPQVALATVGAAFLPDFNPKLHALWLQGGHRWADCKEFYMRFYEVILMQSS